MSDHREAIRSLIYNSEESTKAIARGAGVSEENLTKFVSRRVEKIDVNAALAVVKYLTGNKLTLDK